MTLQKTDLSRLRRRNPRGRYDEETIYGLLDAGLLAHVGYVDDGNPIVTPTAYWREGESLYWHGAKEGRFINAVTHGPVCVTVTHFDGLVFARSGFHHSALHRTVMAFGTCSLVEEDSAKVQALDTFLNRLLPERASVVRPITPQELNATAVVRFHIEEASAKIREGGVQDAERDYGFPVWAGVMKTSFTIQEVTDDDRLVKGVARPTDLTGISNGTILENYLTRRQINV